LVAHVATSWLTNYLQSERTAQGASRSRTDPPIMVTSCTTTGDCLDDRGHPAKLNFGDCFAYALAKITGESLLFKGDDFVRTDINQALP
jgi:hypothetical protein